MKKRNRKKGKGAARKNSTESLTPVKQYVPKEALFLFSYIVQVGSNPSGLPFEERRVYIDVKNGTPYTDGLFCTSPSFPPAPTYLFARKITFEEIRRIAASVPRIYSKWKDVSKFKEISESNWREILELEPSPEETSKDSASPGQVAAIQCFERLTKSEQEEELRGLYIKSKFILKLLVAYNAAHNSINAKKLSELAAQLESYRKEENSLRRYGDLWQLQGELEALQPDMLVKAQEMLPLPENKTGENRTGDYFFRNANPKVQIYSEAVDDTLHLVLIQAIRKDTWGYMITYMANPFCAGGSGGILPSCFVSRRFLNKTAFLYYAKEHHKVGPDRIVEDILQKCNLNLEEAHPCVLEPPAPEQPKPTAIPAFSDPEKKKREWSEGERSGHLWTIHEDGTAEITLTHMAVRMIFWHDGWNAVVFIPEQVDGHPVTKVSKSLGSIDFSTDDVPFSLSDVRWHVVMPKSVCQIEPDYFSVEEVQPEDYMIADCDGIWHISRRRIDYKNVVIYGAPGSVAERFAQEKKYAFSRQIPDFVMQVIHRKEAGISHISVKFATPEEPVYDLTKDYDTFCFYRRLFDEAENFSLLSRNDISGGTDNNGVTELVYRSKKGNRIYLSIDGGFPVPESAITVLRTEGHSEEMIREIIEAVEQVFSVSISRYQCVSIDGKSYVLQLFEEDRSCPVPNP